MARDMTADGLTAGLKADVQIDIQSIPSVRFLDENNVAIPEGVSSEALVKSSTNSLPSFLPNPKGLAPSAASSQLTPSSSSSSSQPSTSMDGESPPVSNDVEQFDVTGYFFWCPARSIDECLLSSAENEDVLKTLKDHIILCWSHQSQGSLRSFILPLRSSSLTSSELHTLVIVTESADFLEQEWHSICNFPKLYVKIGSPLCRGVLRSINIEKCHMCVVHSVQTSTASSIFADVSSVEDNNFSAFQDDSKALLITLNIKNMSYRDIFNKYTSVTFDMFNAMLDEGYKSDSILNSERENALDAGSSTSIPLLTELTNDENVQFIDQDDDDDPDTPFHLTQPFACGRAFAARMIFNPETYDLIRLFVTGTDTEEHDHLMAEGFTEQSCQMSAEQLKTIRNRSRLSLLPVDRGILRNYLQETFEYMFTNSLFNHGILCIGIYRLISITDPNNRFIIANPPPDMQLKNLLSVPSCSLRIECVQRRTEPTTNISIDTLYICLALHALDYLLQNMC
ncbi:hypothetical protein HELRODRAFT_170315 [Helobdella robusta]|uniref:Uncharacterized protein n=1 Tax=Helobdella robusta TaxID=6412 RepID=T1F2X0_HELRO|nr:hypothetical protein HELRODRAFT_170315 [Helobdella robusta]ESO07765.1 hypothetical protein HELRODRAFT_170315 [Helobdella robusta]